MEPVLVVHGGSAGCISCERRQRVRQGVTRAASLGHGVLRSGGSAVDAVEAAVAALEDDPEFNAGHGSVLTADGDVEMDASIMEGRDLAAGAVSAVRCIANPIKLARLVMDKTPHCFLTDRGAANFAAEMGVPQIPGEQLVTEERRKQLEKEQEKGPRSAAQCQASGTVGAVALDCRGNVAYATSTGGITGQMRGRVGDSPCVGSGGYADNDIGAVSTTGHGESILKVNLARLALFHLEQGKSVEEASELALGHMKLKLKALGGLILVSKAGDWAAKWTSDSMPWAAVKGGKLHCGVGLGDSTVEDLP